jgi:aspartokinase/homoserine dehydrogenase 1
MFSKPYRVFKFGGSSVGAPDRILRVTELVESEQRKDEAPIAVVVSAMGDTTDWLIEAAELAAGGDGPGADRVADRITDLSTSNANAALADIAKTHTIESPPDMDALVGGVLLRLREVLHGISLLRQCTLQTMDLVLSFGERTSASVLAALLTARGVPATFVDARDWTVTDDCFGTASVDFEASRANIKALRPKWDGVIPVNTGFLGRTIDGRTTTLGRNGSDYTATLFARAIDAAEVCIWTDVSGVMTADPGIVRDAYPLVRLSYMESVELAYFGTRMFHPRTMIPLIESGIPMRIRNTMRPDDPGTTIDALGGQDSDNPTSVTSLENMALVDIEWRRLSQRAQVGERVLRALDAAEIPVWMATQSAHGQTVAVVIPADMVDQARDAINAELALEMARRELDPLRVLSPVTLLTLVCETMGQSPNVAGRFFHTLGGVGVNIRAIAQGESSRSISCVIDAADTQTAVRTAHTAFNFAHQEVNLAILGKGVVGSQLLAQIAGQRTILREEHGIELKVVALASSKTTVFDEHGIDPNAWAEALENGESHPDGPNLPDLLDKVCRLAVPILVDCTAAGGLESAYRAAFERGVHVAAANKKPLTIPWADRQALLGLAASRHRLYKYETTVGASLPVVDTLKNLVRTGDHVQLIEGCLSGTLGYLTNEVMSGVPLSVAVRTAKELGYTEPRPQEDLSGMDVARKALILARELGLSLDIEQVQVEPLVPDRLLDDAYDVPTFMGMLEDYDAEFSGQIAALKAEGRSLRYLCRIDPQALKTGSGPALTVGPMGVDADHPATGLRGSEGFVAFTTARYQDYPLIVRGAGAGGAVTAAGVLADILSIAQTLRGR